MNLTGERTNRTTRIILTVRVVATIAFTSWITFWVVSAKGFIFDKVDYTGL